MTRGNTKMAKQDNWSEYTEMFFHKGNVTKKIPFIRK